MKKSRICSWIAGAAILLMISAALFIGCGGNDDPPPPKYRPTNVVVRQSSATGTQVTVEGITLANDQGITLYASATVDPKGDQDVTYSWEFTPATAIAAIGNTGGNQATVTAAASGEGTATLKVTAANRDGSNTFEFPVTVSADSELPTAPTAIAISWVEGVLAEGASAVIRNSTTAVFTAAGSGGIGSADIIEYQWAIAAPVEASPFTINGSATNAAVTIRAKDAGTGGHELTVTASRAGNAFSRTFTIQVMANENVVVFAWNSTDAPMPNIDHDWDKYKIPGQIGKDPDGLDKDVFFMARNMWAGNSGNGFPILYNDNGAIKLAGGKPNGGPGDSDNPMYLIIGGWNIPDVGNASDIQTSPTRHVPGLFDLSGGKFKLTVDYKDPVDKSGDLGGTSKKWMFQARINDNSSLWGTDDNNTSDGANGSVLGNSVIGIYYANDDAGSGQDKASDLTSSNPGQIVIEFNSAQFTGANANNYLGTAFVSLVCSPGSSLTLTSIMLEKLVE